MDDKITSEEALTKAQGPLRELHAQADTARRYRPVPEAGRRKDLSNRARTCRFLFWSPAFVTSELKTGFQIGFLIFLPFLVIDIVVAAVMMSLGHDAAVADQRVAAA